MYMTFYRPVLGKVSFFLFRGVCLPKIGLAFGLTGWAGVLGVGLGCWLVRRRLVIALCAMAGYGETSSFARLGELLGAFFVAGYISTKLACERSRMEAPGVETYNRKNKKPSRDAALPHISAK